MSNRYQKALLAVFFASIGATLIAGCGTGDVDPHAKVDAPGYYNGPKEAKGGSATAKKGALPTD